MLEGEVKHDIKLLVIIFFSFGAITDGSCSVSLRHELTIKKKKKKVMQYTHKLVSGVL